MDILKETEDVLVDYLCDLPNEQVRDINDWDDVFNSALTMDAEEELKEHIWQLIKYNLNIKSVVERIKEDLPPASDEEIETEGSESD